MAIVAVELLELLALGPVRTDHDMKYVPLPNTSELVLTSLLPPLRIAPTAFLLPYLPDGTLVLATNRRRGPEVPGGHVEPGETLAETAMRETMEETGCEVTDLRPIGFQRLVSKGVAPEGYRYPFPVSFQQYFTGRVTGMRDFEDNDEVLQPTLVSADMAEASLNPMLLALHRHAVALLFDTGSRQRMAG